MAGGAVPVLGGTLLALASDADTVSVWLIREDETSSVAKIA